jgi:hypothetical protein
MVHNIRKYKSLFSYSIVGVTVHNRICIFFSASPNMCIGCPLGTNVYPLWIVGKRYGTGGCPKVGRLWMLKQMVYIFTTVFLKG